MKTFSTITILLSLVLILGQNAQAKSLDTIDYKLVYTVVLGDCMYKIADKFNLPFAELLKMNPQISNPSRIQAGKTKIVVGRTQPPSSNLTINDDELSFRSSKAVSCPVELEWRTGNLSGKIKHNKNQLSYKLIPDSTAKKLAILSQIKVTDYSGKDKNYVKWLLKNNILFNTIKVNFSLAEIAHSLVGKLKYSQPKREQLGYVDCSRLVDFVSRLAGYKSPGKTTAQQFTEADKVNLADLDLASMTAGDICGWPGDHIYLCLGDGAFIYSSTYGKGVVLATVAEMEKSIKWHVVKKHHKNIYVAALEKENLASK